MPILNGCTNPNCGCSTGIHEGLTFGSGALDIYGYWEHPCRLCAAAWDAAHPEDRAWPFIDDEDVQGDD